MDVEKRVRDLMAMAESQNRNEADVAGRKLAELVQREGLDIVPNYKRIDIYA